AIDRLGRAQPYARSAGRTADRSDIDAPGPRPSNECHPDPRRTARSRRSIAPSTIGTPSPSTRPSGAEGLPREVSGSGSSFLSHFLGAADPDLHLLAQPTSLHNFRQCNDRLPKRGSKHKTLLMAVL